MKFNRMKQITLNDSQLQQQARHGSTLLVVIALLAMLSLLGVVFYTFASQEERSAQYFTEAAVNQADPGLDADVLFNWGLRQLIVGPDDQLYNSALHGKWHSMLPKMFGSDVHPFTGQGINVIMDSSGVVAVDQNYDGTPDNADLLSLNHSRAAHGGTLPFALRQENIPEPDVDYTSPDINNLFLAYDGYTYAGGTLRRVIIPSFVRPQFFRDATSGVHVGDWYENDGTINPDKDTTTRVLRPHPAHVFVDPGGTASTTPRFTSAFPFQPTTVAGGNATAHGELGIFTNSFDSGTGEPILELDVDNDGTGPREGIWMDLDFPPVENPNDPTQFILPLFSFTVYDLDGLINLNTAGNVRKPTDIDPDGVDLNYDPSSNFFGEHSSIYTDKYLFLSRSNMGLSSPGEINPQWALNARPELAASGGDLQGSADLTKVFGQHALFFGAYPYPHGMMAAPPDYSAYPEFQAAYNSTAAWRENSNMEYFFLNFGRPQFSTPATGKATKNEITDLFAGRWGEPDRLYEAQRNNSTDPIYLIDITSSPVRAFPQPGRTLIDDNGNRFEGGTRSGSLIAGNPDNAQSFMHPLSYNGAGRTTKTGTSYRQPLIGYNGWKAYEDFEIAGIPRYNSGSTFFKNRITNVTENYGILVDEADEIIVDMEQARRPYDEPFTPADLAFLHLSQTDQDNTGISSRLSSLLPFNFGRADTVNNRGNSIRKTFTTMSWGRKQFSMADSLKNRPNDDGSISNLDTSNRYLSWLFSADTNNDGKLEFPPDFTNEVDLDYSGNLNYTDLLGNTRGTNIEDLNGSGSRNSNKIAGTALDPFRAPLRQLLTVERGNTTTPRKQMKLDINQVLVYDDTGTGQTVTTRPLTPHPGEDVNGNGALDIGIGEDLNGNGVLDILPSTAINTGWYAYNLPAYPPTTQEQKEFWARYDRQLMARDIYVLLYTLGGSKDNLDYRADNSSNALYTDAQMQEMAQFAVNVVDALDPDEVITRFEYDKNLHDGWGLGDNPYHTDDETTLATNLGISSQAGQRGVVYGVEAQKLTLSEFLAIKAPKVEDASSNEVNHDATEYNDEKDRYFSFIELRNANHQIVSFENDAWQIRLEPRTDAAGISGDYSNLDNLTPDPVLNDTHKRRVTLRSGSVGGGGVFNLRSAGDNEDTDPMSSMPRPSYFRVDPNFAGGTPAYTTIAPRDTSTPAIDLITDDDTADFLMTSEADTVTPISTRGDFLNSSNTDPGGTPNFSSLTFIVRLMRRAHPGRNAPATNNAVDNADNPWVEVDSMVVTGMEEFELQESSMSSAIQSQLNQLRSFERAQPLHARGSGEASHAAGSAGSGYRANTVGSTNSNTGTGNLGADGLPGQDMVDDDNDGDIDDASERGWAFSDDRPRFDIWQPHFDRDFASIVELLSVPVIGPNRVTRDLATESGVQTRTDTSTTVDRANDVRFAGVQKFLDPSGPDDTDFSDPAPTCDDNRWYRILEFLEVPTRIHHQLGNPLADPRVPGRINLNTIRHPAVLAALLDDADAFTMDMTGSAVHPQLVANHLGGDWWREFTESRDARDLGLADAPHIPGTPGSRPFRSFDYATGFTSTGTVNNLRENTIFRSLPTDISSPNPNPRLLFELTTGAEHLGSAGVNKIDVHTRNRLLSKIAANTTTRSNTFVVFMSVAYFEASGAGTTTYGSPVEIGARLSPFDPARTVNQPDYRGFFVIDRTRAEQAFEPSTGQFDHWKRLVRYRHQVQ